MTRSGESKTPILASVAEMVEDGDLRGRTLLTRAAPETTDDDTPLDGGMRGSGTRVPILRWQAGQAPGQVSGRTIITMTKETTDDRGG